MLSCGLFWVGRKHGLTEAFFRMTSLAFIWRVVGKGCIESESQETGNASNHHHCLVSQISIFQYLSCLSGKTIEKRFLVK